METPSPELVIELSEVARNAVSHLPSYLQSISPSLLLEALDEMESSICAMVVSVRDLLYVALMPPYTQISVDEISPEPAIVPFLRKVTAAVIKLVHSARDIQCDSESSFSNSITIVQDESQELLRAVDAYVLEMRNQHERLAEQLRCEGWEALDNFFPPSQTRPCLAGAGAAGSWKGFGWVPLDEGDEGPGLFLTGETIAELEIHLTKVEDQLNKFIHLINHVPESEIATEGRTVITQLFALLDFISNVDIARHVDVDGTKQKHTFGGKVYEQTVEEARSFVRTLETVVQALYDDGSTLLMTIQCLPSQLHLAKHGKRRPFDTALALSDSLKAKLPTVFHTLETLLFIGNHQADIYQGDYDGFITREIGRQRSIQNSAQRLSTITEKTYIPGSDNTFPRHAKTPSVSSFASSIWETGIILPEGISLPDHFDIHHPFEQTNAFDIDESEGHYSRDSSISIAATTGTRSTLTVSLKPEVLRMQPGSAPWSASSTQPTLVDPTSPQRQGDAVNKRIKKAIPEDPHVPPNTVLPCDEFWYMRPDYKEGELLIDPDVGVRGGTVSALVERLTSHEYQDLAFTQTFLKTFKSFTTLDELFDLLVARFNIQPPSNLNVEEHKTWARSKQLVVQTRVLYVFGSMLLCGDILESEDLHILDRMKNFVQKKDVSHWAAAQQLMVLIARYRGGEFRPFVELQQERPPPPIIPKNPKKLKILDIDPLELARQLTILESNLYQKVRPLECLMRSRQSGEHHDNITTIIQLCNKMALWVSDTILRPEASRKRAAVLKYMISVADRCRSLHNYSTMVAIISGLNNPSIRRLKRTWIHLSPKVSSLLHACEETIDTGKNFTNYRTTLANVTAPCVPFIGVFLTDLTFIQDGQKDKLTDDIVNFRKRQKAFEVIQEIKRWQSTSYNLQPVPSVQAFLDASIKHYSESPEMGDHFWDLSLDREPKERDDEFMALMLQDTGLLSQAG